MQFYLLQSLCFGRLPNLQLFHTCRTSMLCRAVTYKLSVKFLGCCIQLSVLMIASPFYHTLSKSLCVQLWWPDFFWMNSVIFSVAALVFVRFIIVLHTSFTPSSYVTFSSAMLTLATRILSMPLISYQPTSRNVSFIIIMDCSLAQSRSPQ